jgi:ubiquinone/menaquinone biosynthesis C-methylase UbiE
MMSVEDLARAFGTAASEYELGRPGYPAEALDLLAEELGLTADAVVIDLGAGTGKLTRELVPRFGRVIAVEPLDEMRAELQRGLPAVETHGGAAEAIPLESASADAVLCAQAFHWFDPKPALEEIARVLRARGGLGLLWNTTPWETHEGEWFTALGDLLDRHCPDRARTQHHTWQRWRAAFDRPGRFEPLSEARRDHLQRQPRAEFLAQIASRSYVAALSASEREEIFREADAMLDRPDSPLVDDEVTVPLHTDVYWTRKR